MANKLYKENPTDKIWWVRTDTKGDYLFSFDGVTIFNLFRDYPFKLSEEQIKTFDEEQPFWADFFKKRKKSVS